LKTVTARVLLVGAPGGREPSTREWGRELAGSRFEVRKPPELVSCWLGLRVVGSSQKGRGRELAGSRSRLAAPGSGLGVGSFHQLSQLQEL
jgi:hypothetical protein